MKHLFDSTTINGMRIKNRIVRSATWEGMCKPNGCPTQKLVDCYQALAKGEVGLIITGYTYVCPEGKQQPGKMGLYSDDFSEEYLRLTQTVHDAGGTIAIQLVHAGGQANQTHSGHPTVAPSAIETLQYQTLPHELTVDQIHHIVYQFARAAKRSKQWGFDGVQLHGAHGYLINQFLSPLTNRRKDTYGGTLENRFRFLKEIFLQIRERVGTDYPVLIKMNGADNLDGGFAIEESVQVAKWLCELGIDAIEVSAGTSASGDLSPARGKIKSEEDEGYNLILAKKIKTSVSCPVMVVGGFRSVDIVEAAIDAHHMDYTAMSRPFIREPDLAKRWKNGDRSKAKCISCNRCFVPGLKGGVFCMAERKQRQHKRPIQ